MALLVTTALTFAATVLGVLAYTGSPAHRLGHDPDHGLQQLDLLYLDEAAPQAARLGLQEGEPALIVFCDGCRVPRPRGAQVLTEADPALADAYALGEAGTGYALVDGRGRLRYRTYDPAPAQHLREIQRLVDALPRR